MAKEATERNPMVAYGLPKTVIASCAVIDYSGDFRCECGRASQHEEAFHPGSVLG
jgi:hypothetical protein